MADIPSLNRDFPDIGGDENSWGEIAEDIWSTMALKMNATTAISTTGGTTTLSESQELVGAIVVTGVLGSNAILEFSGRVGGWLIFNQTTGAYTLTARIGGAGATQQIARGDPQLVFSNGSAWISTGKSQLLAGTVTSASSLSLNLSSYVSAGYTRFRIFIFNLKPSVGGVTFGAALSADGGSTALAGLTQQAVEQWGSSGSLQANEGVIGSTAAYLFGQASTSAPVIILFELVLGATNSFWVHQGYSYYTSGVGSGVTRGGGQVLGVVNALLIGPTSGNIATAAYVVEGFR
jgi:hypothetical protein